MNRQMKRLLQGLALLSLPGLFIGYQVMAQSGSSAQPPVSAEFASAVQAINRSLGAATQGQLSVLEVRETPLEALIEVTLNSGEVLYSDHSGAYLITGDMLMTGEQGFVNITADTRKSQNAALVAAIPAQQMISFIPENQLAEIRVFTDVDCTFCRRLHHDIEDILANGIAVHYLAFPRGGQQSGAYDKMVSVWCADDQHRAMTQAKNGQNLPGRDCDSPVLSHWELGNRIGISGTPALVLEDGTVVPGYLDVDRLTAVVLAE